MPAWVNASVQQPFVLHMHVVHASQTAIVGKNFTETIDADPAPGRRRYAHPRVSLGWPSTNRRPTERMPEWRGCNASPQPWETCGDCPPHTVSMGGRAHIARVTSVVVPVARLSQPLSMLHARPPSVDASNVSEVVDILRNGRRFWGGRDPRSPVGRTRQGFRRGVFRWRRAPGHAQEYGGGDSCARKFSQQEIVDKMLWAQVASVVGRYRCTRQRCGDMSRSKVFAKCFEGHRSSNP